ncbi:PLD nuclease N-terminal domain-containing protein [Streptomyces sp. NPDC060194]|uniref:PLD nuclease N-terminal domain-containing protein n=1 Tax=Streptomyces sp. NPDC060194 TaxID=3347069 RepID=UPI003663F3BB
MLRVLMFVIPLALTIYAFIDCLNTPEDEVKHLPKIAWVFIVLLFWIVGPVAWLATGKTRQPAGGRGGGDRWGGQRARWVAPDDNPDFLDSLRRPPSPNGDRPAPEDEASDPAAPGEADPRKREPGKAEDEA